MLKVWHAITIAAVEKIPLTKPTHPDNEPYDAEKHLTLGTPESAETLAKLEYEWYTNDEPHTAAIYASRAMPTRLSRSSHRDSLHRILLLAAKMSAAPAPTYGCSLRYP